MALSTSVLVIFGFVVVGVFSYPLDSNPENDTAKDSFQPVSLPTDFGSYDPNANGYIDLEELAKVTGTMVDDARKPFMDADIDDDDQVSPAEFVRAPWSLSLRNGEVVSEDDNDDDNDEDAEEEVKVDTDGEEEEAQMDASDDDGEETPADETDEEEVPIDESDYNEESVRDYPDDTLLNVGNYSEDGDEEEEYPVEKSNDDTEDNEKTKEEYDDGSQNIEIDEVETDDAFDPLLEEKEDPLSRQEDVISENEFVENAIF